MPYANSKIQISMRIRAVWSRHSTTCTTISIDFVSGQRRPWSACANAQADQGLRCLQLGKDPFRALCIMFLSEEDKIGSLLVISCILRSDAILSNSALTLLFHYSFLWLASVFLCPVCFKFNSFIWSLFHNAYLITFIFQNNYLIHFCFRYKILSTMLKWNKITSLLWYLHTPWMRNSHSATMWTHNLAAAKTKKYL